jgi:hypothetical protein
MAMVAQYVRRMPEHLDGRARFGVACGIVALSAFTTQPFGTLCGASAGPIAIIFSLASLISVDEPPTGRTRRVAITGTVLAAAGLAFALVTILTGAQRGD